MKKLQNLEGLRGVAALIVVFYHFIYLFMFNLMNLHSDKLNPIINFIVRSPVNVIYNGFFAVSIFFVLSGFVLSYKFFKTGEAESIISTAFKRYIRLVIPVAFSILLIYVLVKIDPENIYSIVKDPGICDIIFEGFIGCFLAPSQKYNLVVWTMYYELSGSFLVFGFCLIFNKRRNRILGYIIAMIFFWGTHYFAFLAGILLSDLYVIYGNYLKNRFLKVFLLAIAIFLGSYPIQLFDQKIINTSIYSIFNYITLKNIHIIYHSLGATLLLMVIMNSSRLSLFFSSRIFSFFGRISFSVYLIHYIVLQYFSSYLFNYLNKEFITSFSINFIITLILSIIFIILLSLFMTKYIDQSGIKFVNYLYDKFFKGIDRNKIVDIEFYKIKNYLVNFYSKSISIYIR